MSRVGRLPVKITAGTQVTYNDKLVTVKGKLGELKQKIENASINVEVKDAEVVVTRSNDEKETKAATASTACS